MLRDDIRVRAKEVFEEGTINVVGGICKLREQELLIINSKATEKDKIKVFVQKLRHFDLDQIYFKPAIRHY
jgi:hypothetical protein